MVNKPGVKNPVPTRYPAVASQSCVSDINVKNLPLKALYSQEVRICSPTDSTYSCLRYVTYYQSIVDVFIPILLPISRNEISVSRKLNPSSVNLVN